MAGFDAEESAALKSIFQEAFGQSVGNIRRFPGYDPKDEGYYQDGERNISATVNVGDDDYDAEVSEKGNLGPAPLTVRPTSSSNAKRPRTVAAGYQRYVGSRANPENRPDDAPDVYNLGKLTVMFRDGTLYNYYDVTPEEWSKFKAQISKGPMLNWKPVPGFLLAKPHGPADMSNVSEAASKTIYMVARETQWRLRNNRKVTVHVSEGPPGSATSRSYEATGTVPKRAQSALGKNTPKANQAHRAHKPHSPRRHSR